MKQNVYSEIEGALIEVDELLRIKDGGDHVFENEYLKKNAQGNPGEILMKIKRMHQLLLKVKHREMHQKLSEREVEIIRRIINGMTTNEIAKVLNISKHTVESHRTNIFSKLDVRNVAELVALAFRVGLVE